MRKKKKFNSTLWMSLFIAFIMVLSILGIMVGETSPSGSKIKYNDFTFFRVQDGFMTKINKKDVRFSYFPSDLENITIDPAIKDNFNNINMVYLTYNPNQPAVQAIANVLYSLKPILDDFFNIYSANSMTVNNTYNLPVITCANATSTVPVIDFRESNSTQLLFEDNCIIFEASSASDFVLLKDRLLYSLFGILD